MQTRNKQFGGARGLIVGGIVGFFAFCAVAMAWNWRNTAIDCETGLQAQDKDNQNVFDSVWKRINQVAQVPEMQKNDFKEVFTAAMQGRYGQNGSEASFQWIQEHNPNLNTEVYIQIQRVIESGRKEFEAAQTMLLDKKKMYQNHLRQGLGPLWAHMMSYPTIDLSKYDIVTSTRTEKVFQDKKDDDVKIR